MNGKKTNNRIHAVSDCERAYSNFGDVVFTGARSRC